MVLVSFHPNLDGYFMLEAPVNLRLIATKSFKIQIVKTFVIKYFEFAGHGK